MMTDYDTLARQLEALLDTRDWLTNAAQTAAFVFHSLEQVNWVGFYVQRQYDTLVLGPFQGKPACNPITFGQGVCGTAATTRETQRIADVAILDNHIVCDPTSRAELVVPLCIGNYLWGVLDIDSPQPQRFDDADVEGVERLAAVFTAASDLDGMIARDESQRQAWAPASVTT